MTARSKWKYAGHVVHAHGLNATTRHRTSDGTLLDGTHVDVAVYDTGLEGGEADRANQRLRFFDESRVAYTTQLHPQGTWDGRDLSGHGTHVAGIIAHVLKTNGAITERRGLAPEVNLLIQNQMDHDFIHAVREAYRQGIRIHNHSWAHKLYMGRNGLTIDSTRAVRNRFEPNPHEPFYHPDAAAIDAEIVAARDLLLVVGSSNEGPGPRTLGSPGVAKNVLTVGACRNRIQPQDAPNYAPSGSAAYLPISPDDISTFSSRGPTSDGRVKPDVVAPGECVLAPRSLFIADGEREKSLRFGLVAGYVYMNGTSMATPVVSAAAALVRQWLRIEHNVSSPSAALMKALLVHCAEPIPGQGYASMESGFGRINLDNLFAFRGGQIFLFDEATALQQGHSWARTLNVAGTGKVKATLVWTDPAGTVDAIGAPGPKTTPQLVNNLDLVLTEHDPKHHRDFYYRGNVFSDDRMTSRQLWQPTDRPPDLRNNVEVVETLVLDASWQYRLRIDAPQINGISEPNPNASTAHRQAFALVVSGPIGSIT